MSIFSKDTERKIAAGFLVFSLAILPGCRKAAEVSAQSNPTASTLKCQPPQEVPNLSGNGKISPAWKNFEGSTKFGSTDYTVDEQSLLIIHAKNAADRQTQLIPGIIFFDRVNLATVYLCTPKEGYISSLK